MDSVLIFRKIFWSAFQRPKLNSHKFNDLWVDLVEISDQLAGPLYSIFNNGNCNYVFMDEEGRFPAVTSPESFLAWENDLLQSYRKCILNKKTRGFREEADYKVLYQQAEVMEVLARLAYEIQKARTEIKS